MSAVFVMFAWFQAQGVSPIVSTYVSVLFAAAAVTILELAFPNRTAWRPPTAEIKTDLVFMTTIQLALPPLVGFLFVYLLIGPVPVSIHRRARRHEPRRIPGDGRPVSPPGVSPISRSNCPAV